MPDKVGETDWLIWRGGKAGRGLCHQGRNSHADQCRMAIEFVFVQRPESRVIDGDASDLVNVKAGAVIVGLKAKGKALCRRRVFKYDLAIGVCSSFGNAWRFNPGGQAKQMIKKLCTGLCGKGKTMF